VHGETRPYKYIDIDIGHGYIVCICVYSVSVLSYVYAEALRRADHSSKESYRLQIDQETEKRPEPTRAAE
jgi:hypothetical protein